MPRQPRNTPGGFVYHVSNRAAGNQTLFQKDPDYLAFETVLDQALRKHPIRLLAYGVMPNHWHLLLWPEGDEQVTGFVRWLTHTHAVRWRTHYGTIGAGALYQGRFKAFPVQEDEHLSTVARYIEANALRAGLVTRAEDWRWSSLIGAERLSAWPLPRPEDWLARVNEPLTEEELAALRLSVVRGSPFGSADWQAQTAKRLGLECTLRPRGRPRKTTG